MLSHLSVQNYALIDKIEFDPSAGLTIITGETGAGKSILLGALSLIAGERADTTVLMDKTRKCIVEAVFHLKGTELKEFFLQNDLDYSDLTTIRREISPESKSRAFINDTPVNLTQLRALSTQLIDIHSQHETIELNESSYHMQLTDAFSGLQEQVHNYSIKFRKWKEAEARLAELVERNNKALQDADYWQFQWDELEGIKLIPGEQEKAETELNTLENADEIRQMLEQIQTALEGEEGGALGLLGECKTRLNNVAKLNPEFQKLSSRLNSAYIEVKDLNSELGSLSEKIQADPDRLQYLTDRLDELNRLQKKHQVRSVEELIEVKNKIRARLGENESLAGEISSMREHCEQERAELFTLARNISVRRLKSLSLLEKEVKKCLSLLALPQAEFKADHILLEQLSATGIDKIRFLFSANKGGELKPIQQSASGGELSRLMLALKALVAQKTSLPTILFDEIDTGVSGAVAEQVGKMIEGMGEVMQVITITHLPQIGSKGNTHFVVYKEVVGKTTQTLIRKLNAKERVEEIAKMLSAGKPTEASLKNAKELLKA